MQLLPLALKATYDPESNTAYIYLRDEAQKPVKVTVLSPTMMADLDETGRIIGIEILDFVKKTKQK